MTSRFEHEKCVTGRCRCVHGHGQLPSPTARHVALTIGTFADSDGTIPVKFSPSLTTIARATGLNRATVARAVRDLADQGWLQREAPARPSMKATNYYRLTVPTGCTAPLVLVAEDDQCDQSRSATSRGVRPELVAENDTTSRTARHNQPFQNLPAAASPPGTDLDAFGGEMKTDLRDEQLARIAEILQVEDPDELLESWARHRVDVRNPLAVIQRMSDDELRSSLRRYRSQPKPAPACAACNGLGKQLDPQTRLPTRETCTTCHGSRRTEAS